MLNRDALNQLIALSKNDIDVLDVVWDAIDAFGQYYAAVLADQTFPMIYGGNALDGEEFRNRRMELDKQRTTCHNSLIAHVRILNRLAEQYGIPAIYDGVVSEERPYRRQVADAVFEYTEWIVNNRK